VVKSLVITLLQIYC